MKQSYVKISKGVEELFFVISPPPHIKSDVSVLKDDVQYLTGNIFEDRYSVAHISLFRFVDEQHFDDIIREVELRATYFSPFNVFIKGLKAFQHGSNRTIHLDIVNKYQVSEIFEKLVKEDNQYSPYISIAKKLTDEEFSHAWPYLEDFCYNQHFLCDRITVLARTDGRWIHYKDIVFGNFSHWR
jgi:hypothetical protein